MIISNKDIAVFIIGGCESVVKWLITSLLLCGFLSAHALLVVVLVLLSGQWCYCCDYLPIH